MSSAAASSPREHFICFAQVSLAVVAIASFAHAARAQTDSRSAAEFCSKSAEAAKTSCGHEARADFWLAAGICANLPYATRQRTCLLAAEDERSDALELCAAQSDARDDVCDALGEAAYAPPINPTNFVRGITNKYFPLKPGTSLVYRGETDAGIERVVVTVQRRTRTILGVVCTQVRDTARLDGVITEDTLDWYAQDKQGNVWYFGESTQEFEDGLPVSLEGSWQAGVDGALPGIIMKAHPGAGNVYRQEFLLGSAEDLARVLSASASATVPVASCHGNCVLTHDFTPVEPDLNERKYFAPNVGFILEIDQATGDRLELVAIQGP